MCCNSVVTRHVVENGFCFVCIMHVDLTVFVVKWTSSREDTVDVQPERKRIIVIPRSQPKEPPSDNVPDISSAETDGKVTYHPSETCRLVQEQDSGIVQSNINPLTGVEMKSSQSKKMMMLDRTLA